MSARTAEVAEAVLVWRWARYTRLHSIVAVILLSPRRTVEPALRHPPYEKTPNLLNRLCNGTVEVDSYLVNQQSTSPARFLYVSGRYAASLPAKR